MFSLTPTEENGVVASRDPSDSHADFRFKKRFISSGKGILVMMNLIALCDQPFAISRAQTDPRGGLGGPPPKDGGPVRPFHEAPYGSSGGK